RQCAFMVTTVKFYSIVASLFSGFLRSTSLWAAIVEKEASVDTIFDMLVFPGAISDMMQTDLDDNHDAFYSPLQGDKAETTNWDDGDVTPFAKAGLLSKVTLLVAKSIIEEGRKSKGSSHSPPILSTLFLWHWKAISVAGVFALMKILAMSAGPLILMAFIEVAEGEEAFKYEGYALTAILFPIEMYRVGVVAIAAVIVIILTVIGNSPLAKLQHKYQFKFVAQDKMLQAITEALMNMKILKLYAWESHFKKVHRRAERKGVLMDQSSSDSKGKLRCSLLVICRFSTSRYILVHATSLEFHLMLAKFSRSQGSSRLLSFKAKGEHQLITPKEGRYSMYIKTTGISWYNWVYKAYLWDINLTVKPGEKVAICGEVGARKTTLLATILGEVPNIDGIDYVMEALSGKTVLLVTHQVYSLPDFDSILIISDGEILRAATYHELLVSSVEFQCLVNAHETAGVQKNNSKPSSFSRNKIPNPEIQKLDANEQVNIEDQLIKKEEKETGDTGLKPHLQYLRHGRGFLYFSLSNLFLIFFIVGQFVQNYWSGGLQVHLLSLLESLFRAPISFYDSTPLGRILSRVSSDLSLVDLDVPNRVIITVGGTNGTYFSFAVLAFFAWELLFVIIPMIYLIIVLQGYYFASAKELMRITGISKSAVASHVAETAAGAMTIQAFGEERQMSLKNLDLIDKNASPFFHSFAATELIYFPWLSPHLISLITVSNILTAEFIGMALSYGLSLNLVLTATMQNQCLLANMMISVERLEQYMHISCEVPEIVDENRAGPGWPSVGRVEIHDLRVRYRPDAPLVLKGISCIFEGGWKVGIVGRTGSGKTTLINTLFRLVEPSEGKIIVDDVDISKIGLHDLRSHFGIIPQEPILFGGSVRYNLDPLAVHTDEETWEGYSHSHFPADSSDLSIFPCNASRDYMITLANNLILTVVQDGSNWSMGQRQLICLGRALLKKHKVLVLDEATAPIDNARDTVIQRIIQTAFADCTVITVAHRIPTVMDCTRVLAMCDGKMMEYDDPRKLMTEERSLFGQLVREYWSHTTNASKGVSANSNTSVDVSYNTLDSDADSDADSDESCRRDEITNEALWSDNEEVFEVRRQKAIMERLMEKETMGNNKNVATITPSSRQTLQYGVNFSRQQVGDSVPSLPTQGREPILFAEAAPRPIPPQSLSTSHLTSQPRIISSQSLQAHRDEK
ncbi:hypothetical protein Ancab_032762, partial [Ancistrocladus abbreviatus]